MARRRSRALRPKATTRGWRAATWRGRKARSSKHGTTRSWKSNLPTRQGDTPGSVRLRGLFRVAKGGRRQAPTLVRRGREAAQRTPRPNFSESLDRELRRITLPRTPLNRGKKRGQSPNCPMRKKVGPDTDVGAKPLLLTLLLQKPSGYGKSCALHKMPALSKLDSSVGARGTCLTRCQ